MPVYQAQPAEPVQAIVDVVDMEALASGLVPIRDALLKVFDGVRPRARGEVQRLEIGLALTARGDLVIPSDSSRSVIILTLGARQLVSGGRSSGAKGRAPKSDIVRVDDSQVTASESEKEQAT